MTKLVNTFLLAAVVFFTGVSESLSASKLTAENVKIVDCLLPGKVKKLGINRVFLSKKRPVKTSVNDCEIRGGEYTQYDRANIESALKVWQGAAILGDPQAQFYVGEIFEDGAGGEPNYQQALNWYQQAAAQSYKPALMALGKLHESGLGVPKDLVKSMNYYRQASGLTGDDIEYASVFKVVRQQDLQKISTLEGELEESRAVAQQLGEELIKLQSNLSDSEKNLRNLQQEINSKNSEIKKLNTKVKQQPLVSTRALENDLSEANFALENQNRLVASLKSELALIKLKGKSNASADLIEGTLTSSRQQLKQQTDIAELQKNEIEDLKFKLQGLKRKLKEYSPKQRVKLVEEEYRLAHEQIQQQLASANAKISDQKLKIADLEAAAKSTGSKNRLKEAALQYELENARQELNASVFESKQKERKVSILQQEIDFLQQQGKKSESQQSVTMTMLKTALDQRSKLYDDEIAKINLELSSRAETIGQLEQQLAETRGSLKNKKKRVAELEQKIASSLVVANEAKTTIAEKDKLIQEKLATIQSLEERIAQLPTLASLETLKTTLADKQKELTKERNDAVKLSRNIEQLREDKEKAEARLNKVAPDDGPVIAVRWPKIDEAKEGISTVSAGSTVSVVGAVYPPKTVKSLSVNGEALELDTNGMFLHIVEVGNQPLDLTLSAIDDLGRESTKSITIKPSYEPQYAGESNGGLTVPKVKFGKYHALIIGNNEYESDKGWPALNTAVNDAKAVAKLLKDKYGFKTTLILNATRSDMVVGLEKMRSKLSEKENLLIYFAGHGYMDPENDQGYWIPVNGSTTSTADWVSNSTITEQIRATSARNIMVIADSCYSASLTRSGVVSLRSGLSPEKKMERLKADLKSVTRMALSSGGLQPVADAIDDSGHSVFANALLKLLKKNKSVLDGTALATKVGLSVAVATEDNVQQVPQYAPLHKGGHEGGEFYFVPRS